MQKVCLILMIKTYIDKKIKSSLIKQKKVFCTLNFTIYKILFVINDIILLFEMEQDKSQKTQQQGQLESNQLLNLIASGKGQKNNDYWRKLFFQKHSFWNKQPVFNWNSNQKVAGNIEGQRRIQDVRKQPIDLPDQKLFWCQIDVTKDEQLDELYQFLFNNFAQNDLNNFKLDYSHQFLRWVLTPPGYQKSWLIGLRNQKKQLIASITGIPAIINAEDKQIKMAQIKFLCISKNYQKKQLTPLLISEVTRRINLRGKWQAIYATGKILPTPFTQASYWIRPLNSTKLVDTKFWRLRQNQTIEIMKKLYKLPEECTIQELRPMNKKDVASLTKLINTCLQKFIVKAHFTQEQVKHYFMPRQGVMYTYVKDKIELVDGKKKNIITDVLSFYSLPYNVYRHPKYTKINTCYSFFNFATTVNYEQLIRCALILAQSHGFDLYNSLNVMDNQTAFQNLFFKEGNGKGVLNYYFYNWMMKKRHINPKQLGIVLL